MKTYTLQKTAGAPISPVNVGFEYCRPAHSYGPSTRSHLLIHYVLDGKGRFTTPRGEYEVTEGMCFVIRESEVTYYRADNDRPWHYVWIGFHTSFRVPDCLKNDVIHAPYARRSFLDIEEAYPQIKSASDGTKEAFISGKIAEILTLFYINSSIGETSPAKKLTDAAKNYIDQEYANHITVSDIARRFNHERTYFSRLFKQEEGVSPKEYLVTRRLAEAARLMLHHGFSPTLAANAVGYEDIYLFSKMFKSRYGISPREYLKRNSATGNNPEKN